MQYVPPVGGADNDPYIDGNPSSGVEGSAVPAAAIEHPMREIEAVIVAAGLTPDESQLDQLLRAITKVKGVQRFTSNGSFTVPAGVTTIYVSACAGGGGGGGNATVGDPNIISGAGGGGAGQSIICQEYAVTPGEVIPITIGAGGTAGAVNTVGGAGGNTVVGVFVTLTGGSGGGAGNASEYSVYTAGAVGGVGYPAGFNGQDTGPVGQGASSGMGASSIFGTGGPSVRGQQTGNAQFQGVGGSGHGSGGSGAGGVYAAGLNTTLTSAGATGGAGAPGLVIIEY